MYGDLKHCSLFIIAYNDVWRFIDNASSNIVLNTINPPPPDNDVSSEWGSRVLSLTMALNANTLLY